MIRDALFGLAIGDALGVPVEFQSRERLRQNPVTDMIGYGTFNLPAGTWSDDSSLAFCLAEALRQDFSLKEISKNFQQWLYSNYWTPYGYVFDVGITTQHAIENLSTGISPDLAAGFNEYENGNGSLMRILPLLFYIKDKTIEERFQLTKAVSSITHGHIRSVISCFYYLEFARELLKNKNKFFIYDTLKELLPDFLFSLSIPPEEVNLFNPSLSGNIHNLQEQEIQSSGYVLDTLEASIWCLLTTNSYKDAVLKEVNLGNDTDTTGSVTGGLAGLLYGFDNIPESWVEQLARRDEIEELAASLTSKFAYC